MRILVDECLPRALAAEFSRRGHDCLKGALICPGWADKDVLARATDEKRILVSEDRDFGTLVFRERQAAYGIIALYISRFDLPFDRLISAVADRITALENISEGHFVIIEPTQTRLRKLPGKD